MICWLFEKFFCKMSVMKKLAIFFAAFVCNAQKPALYGFSNHSYFS